MEVFVLLETVSYIDSDTTTVKDVFFSKEKAKEALELLKGKTKYQSILNEYGHGYSWMIVAKTVIV